MELDEWAFSFDLAKDYGLNAESKSLVGLVKDRYLVQRVRLPRIHHSIQLTSDRSLFFESVAPDCLKQMMLRLTDYDIATIKRVSKGCYLNVTYIEKDNFYWCQRSELVMCKSLVLSTCNQWRDVYEYVAGDKKFTCEKLSQLPASIISVVASLAEESNVSPIDIKSQDVRSTSKLLCPSKRDLLCLAGSCPNLICAFYYTAVEWEDKDLAAYIGRILVENSVVRNRVVFDCGVITDAVMNGHIEVAKLCITSPNFDGSMVHEVVCAALKVCNLEILETIFNAQHRVSMCDVACDLSECKERNIIDLMLDKCEANADDLEECIFDATRYDNIRLVEACMEREEFDISIFDELIEEARSRGHDDIAKLLAKSLTT